MTTSLKLDLYQLVDDAPLIRPAPQSRAWMDETQGFAYRCLPLTIANTTGWFITEAGRQPWIVVGLQKTMEAFSPVLAPGEVLMTLVGYTLVYLFLALAALYAALRYIRKTPARLEDWRDA